MTGFRSEFHSVPMTPQEEHWLKDYMALMGRENLDRIADTEVLLEMLTDLIIEISGEEVDAASVKASIRERMNRKRESLILTIGDSNPALAALLDQKPKPPQAPPQSS